MGKMELNEEMLNNIAGGQLTDEAKDWIDRNRETILGRAGFLKLLADKALDYVTNCEDVYDVAALKSAIEGYGIKVSDLN